MPGTLPQDKQHLPFIPDRSPCQGSESQVAQEGQSELLAVSVHSSWSGPIQLLIILNITLDRIAPLCQYPDIIMSGNRGGATAERPPATPRESIFIIALG